MSKLTETGNPDPFALGGRNGEIATDPVPKRAGEGPPSALSMAAQPGDIAAADPPNRSETMPDGYIAAASEDPVLAILPRLAEAGVLAEEGDDDASDRFVAIQGELARVT